MVILGELPALPLHTAGKYVASAYVVLFAVVLIYVAIMAVRLGRVERELGELLELAEGPHAQEAPESEASKLGVGRTQDKPGDPELSVGRAQAAPAAGTHDVGRPQSTAVGAQSE